MSGKVWDEFTYPFQNFNGYTVDVWEWKRKNPTLHNGCDYLSVLGQKPSYNLWHKDWHNIGNIVSPTKIKYHEKLICGDMISQQILRCNKATSETI